MNKGLLAHIIGTMIYAILVLYITGDNETNVGVRVFIVMMLLLFNLFTSALCDINDWYNEKI